MELKEVLDYLGLDAEKVKTIDDLKGTFEKEFVRASTLNEENDFVKPILGKTYGTLENELKKIAKKYEVDFDEFKDAKKVSEKAEMLITKIATEKDSKINEFKTKLEQGSDEKLTAAEKKAEKLAKELKEKNALLDATVNDFNGFKQNAATELKNFKLNTVKSSIFNGLKYNSQATELAKKGFLATIHEKYEFDFDEKDQPIIRTKGGTQIKSDKVAGAFLSPDEVIKKEAIDAGLYEVNPNAQQQQRTITITPTGQQNNNAKVLPNGNPARTVAPRLG